MSRVLINGQDVNYTSDFPEMTYDKWKALPEDLRPNYTVITDRDYTGGEPTDNSVSITADGVKTYSQLLDELYALVDKSKISRNAKLVKTRYSDGQTLIFSLVDIVSSTYIFTYSYVYNSSDSPRESISMMSSGSKFAKIVFYTFTDNSSSVPASGDIFTLYYNTVSSGGSIEITADDVSYGIGTVEDALDNIAKHAFGQDVSLASYSTSSNKFTVPADGYIYVASTDLTSSSPDYRLDVKCGNFVLCSLSKRIQRITTFVRKGMQIYYTNYYYSVDTNCFIQYTPLV